MVGYGLQNRTGSDRGGNQGRRERRDNDTGWGNLLISERISWSDERSKQDGSMAVESRGCENVYPKWKTLQTGITDPGSFLQSETRKNSPLIDEISN